MMLGMQMLVDGFPEITQPPSFLHVVASSSKAPEIFAHGTVNNTLPFLIRSIGETYALDHINRFTVFFPILPNHACPTPSQICCLVLFHDFICNSLRRRNHLSC
jgi:hypothetical protein